MTAVIPAGELGGVPSHTRLALLFAVVASVCLASPAAEVAARGGGRAETRQARVDYPPPPAPGHQPRFVHQLFNNCAFASAEMLIDKWTGGRRSAAQQRLRRATGIAPVEGGPTLSQLTRAVARIARIDLRWSPYGGDAMTWDDLLTRLANGGGALVNVWPAKLPRHYRRWQPALTAGHSVFIERYQPDKDRLWLMDPLGRGKGFRGEWIDADVLSRAMWHTAGYVWAAATPPRPRDPALVEFDLGELAVPVTAFSGAHLTVAIGYEPRRFDARLPELRLFASWQRAADDEPSVVAVDEAADEATLVADRLAGWTGVAPSVPLTFEVLTEPLAADGAALTGELPTPAVPGEYTLTLELRDGDGQTRATDAPLLAPVSVRIYGPLAGSVEPNGDRPATTARGQTLSVSVDVTNLGSTDWGPDAAGVELAASWDGVTYASMAPLELESAAIHALLLNVPVDVQPGPATLRLTLLRDGVALPGSEPLELAVEVIPGPPKLADTR